MTEVRTQPVEARFVGEDEFFDEGMRARVPGSICVQKWIDEGDPNSQRWLYACPCGCGASGALRVGVGSKPPASPSWAWTGGEAAAVLSPSVYHVGHWHGHLGGASGERPGWWISV